jgi:hypothetical protein
MNSMIFNNIETCHFVQEKKFVGKLSWFPLIWWKIVNLMTFNNIESHNMPS